MANDFGHIISKPTAAPLLQRKGMTREELAEAARQAYESGRKPRQASLVPAQPAPGADVPATAAPRFNPLDRILHILGEPLWAPGVAHMFMFCVGLRSCLVSGVPIVRAFELMGASTPHRWLRNSCRAVARDLSDRVPLEIALAKRRRVFKPFFTNLFLGGLRSGSIGAALNVLIAHYAWVRQIRSVLLSILIYPICLIFAGALVMTVRDCIMQSMQVGITTQGVLRISWMYFSGPILGLLAAIVLTRIFKSNSVRPMFDEFVMRVPGLRSLYGRIALARFFRMLAAYVESGHEVGAGLQAAISAMDNHYYARRLRRAIAFVRAGESFADGLALTGVMDRQALSMIHAGEAVGALPELAPRLADYYETEVRTLLPGLAKASYPAMIILIAVAYFVNPMFLGLGAFLMFFLLFMTV